MQSQALGFASFDSLCQLGQWGFKAEGLKAEGLARAKHGTPIVQVDTSCRSLQIPRPVIA